MKRTVSWLAKLFVSSVVALALVVTLGVQQAQAYVDTGYCCTGSKTSLNPDESCKIQYTDKYQFQVAYIGNLSEDTAIVSADYHQNQIIQLDPYDAKEVYIFDDETFALEDGGPVNFVCSEYEAELIN